MSEQRITGALLILAFVAFAIGATLPLVGEMGNSRIFTLPTHEYLVAVAANPVVWRWANIFMGAAIVLLVAGLTLLASQSEAGQERILARLGLVGMLVAATLWLAFSAFRATVTINAAQEVAATSAIPGYYEPLAHWASALFYAYAVIASLL